MKYDDKRRIAYEKLYTNKQLQYPAEELVRILFPLYPDEAVRSGKLTFDMGAGCGRNTIFLAENNFDVVALEGAVSGCIATGKRLGEIGLPYRGAVAGEFADLPFSNNIFDLVIAWETILYGRKEEVRCYLAEALRILKRGGRIIFTLRTPDYGPHGDEVGPNEYRISFGADSGAIYSTHTLEEAYDLCVVGLQVDAIEHYGYTLDNRKHRYDSWIIIAVKTI